LQTRNGRVFGFEPDQPYIIVKIYKILINERIISIINHLKIATFFSQPYLYAYVNPPPTENEPVYDVLPAPGEQMAEEGEKKADEAATKFKKLLANSPVD
jgi:hypothetical protein